MKKHCIQYTFYLITALTLLGSCKKKDGEIGPKGATGDKGAVGVTGPKGTDAQLIYKNGFISGTVTGLGKDGITPINENFRYEFSYSSLPAVLTKRIINGIADTTYTINFALYDSLNTSSAILSFNTETSLTNSTADFSSGTLSLIKKVNTNQYKELSGYYYVSRTNTPKKGSVTNLKYDQNTGMLSADFTWSVDNTNVYNEFNYYYSVSNTGQPFTVKGAFSIKCILRTEVQ
ncbi:MAG: hypothetical protein V4714_06335 [Bacteroidota bacterium]